MENEGKNIDNVENIKVDPYNNKTKDFLIEKMGETYRDQEKIRNSLISGTSVLLGFVGILFTIQTTMIIPLMDHFKEIEKVKIPSIIIFLISLGLYATSIYFLLKSNEIKEYSFAPNNNLIKYYYENLDIDLNEMKDDVFYSMNEAITANDSIHILKADNIQKGHILLILGLLFTLIFVAFVLGNLCW